MWFDGGLRVPEGFRGYAIPVKLVTPALLADLETYGSQVGTPCYTSDDYVVGRMLHKHKIRTQGFSLVGVPGINVSASDADPRGLKTQNHWNMYHRCNEQIQKAEKQNML